MLSRIAGSGECPVQVSYDGLHFSDTLIAAVCQPLSDSDRHVEAHEIDIESGNVVSSRLQRVDKFIFEICEPEHWVKVRAH